MRKIDAGSNGPLPALTRRELLKGAGGLGLASLLGSVGLPLRALAQSPPPGLAFPLQRGPYQNNGASPWYASLPLGTPGQTLKFGMDTGSNFIWVTSTLCGSTGCQHYGGKQFNYQASSSFSWTDQTPQTVGFGPWGSMVVETGQDILGLPRGGTSKTTMYLAKNYSGSQFAQLDWDGGIGFPAGSPYVQPGVSFFFADLLNAGLLDPEFPYITFATDADTRTGTCFLGLTELTVPDPYSWIQLPWKPYTAARGVEYLWSTPLQQYSVGSTVVARDAVFALDSGSSQFKGDPGFMKKTLQLINSQPRPNVTLTVGRASDGRAGEITVPPSIYEVLIQAGPEKGQVLPQFAPLDGLADLVLVGSVLMDHFYTVFEYDVTKTSGGYFLAPVSMWLFDKPDGRMIKARGKERATAGQRKPVRPHPARRL